MTGPERVRRLSAPERRLQLIEAACGVIVERGMHAFRIRDVADAAGVSQPLVSAHFRSREELIVAAFEMSDERAYETVLEAASAQPDGRARLSTYLVESLGLEDQRAESWDLWLQIWSYGRFSEPIGDSLRHRQGVWIDLAQRFIAEGQADGSIGRIEDGPRTARLIVTTLDGVISSLRNDLLSGDEARDLVLDAMNALL